jgi:hypothetical protein
MLGLVLAGGVISDRVCAWPGAPVIRPWAASHFGGRVDRLGNVRLRVIVLKNTHRVIAVLTAKPERLSQTNGCGRQRPCENSDFRPAVN